MSKLRELVDTVDRLEVELEHAKHELRKAIGVEQTSAPAPAPVRKYKKRIPYKKTKWYAKKRKKIWESKPKEFKDQWLKAIKEGRRKWQSKSGLTIEQ